MTLNKQIRQFRKKVMERNGEADVAIGMAHEGTYFTIEYIFPPSHPPVSEIGIGLEARYSLIGYGSKDDNKRWFRDKGRNLGCSPWGYFDVVSSPCQLGIVKLYFYPSERKDKISEENSLRREGYELFEIGFEPRNTVPLFKGNSREPIRHDLRSIARNLLNGENKTSYQKLDEIANKYEMYLEEIRTRRTYPNEVIDLVFKIYDEFK